MKIYIVFDGMCDECHSGELLDVYLSEKTAKDRAREWAQEYFQTYPECRLDETRGCLDVVNADGAYIFTIPVVEQEVL